MTGCNDNYFWIKDVLSNVYILLLRPYIKDNNFFSTKLLHKVEEVNDFIKNVLY